MALFVSLLELKKLLEIDPNDPLEDAKLMFMDEYACSWISEWLGRTNSIFYKRRTEYYRGTNTIRLLLRSRPVYITPVPEVYVDEDAWYGSITGSFDSTTALTYGDGFALQIDQDDGVTSRSGILLRQNGQIWPKPRLRDSGMLSSYIGEDTGSIKVIYHGGYTADNCPAQIRLAAITLIAELRQLLPYGFLLGGESYEERSISMVIPQKFRLMGMIEGMLAPFRNWRF